MKTLRSLLSSKKFIVLIAATAVYVLSRFGLEVAQEDAERVVLLASAYLVGQGLADVGKEAAKLNGGEK
jgi:hypothetical protein